MSQWNIAAKSKDEQDKVNVDLAASGVAYKERLNMPVVAEVVAESSQNTCVGISWSACATTGKRAPNYRGQVTHAILKWLSRTPRSK